MMVVPSGEDGLVTSLHDKGAPHCLSLEMTYFTSHISVARTDHMGRSSCKEGWEIWGSKWNTGCVLLTLSPPHCSIHFLQKETVDEVGPS